MRNFQIVDMSVFAMKDPMPKQRVVNDGLKVAVDGYHVPQNEVGRAVQTCNQGNNRSVCSGPTSCPAQ